jgi:hypothetical protein
VSGSGSALWRTRRAAHEASTTPSDGVTHADRPIYAAASCAQIDGANRPDRKADASASMLRRARRRNVPGDSPNSAAVPANAGADISPGPLRHPVRAPNRSVCSTREASRSRSPGSPCLPGSVCALAAFRRSSGTSQSSRGLGEPAAGYELTANDSRFSPPIVS